MPATVVLDELHLTFLITAALTAVEVRSIHRVLNGKAFTAAIQHAVLAVMNKYPVTAPVRVTVTR